MPVSKQNLQLSYPTNLFDMLPNVWNFIILNTGWPLKLPTTIFSNLNCPQKKSYLIGSLRDTENQMVPPLLIHWGTLHVVTHLLAESWKIITMWVERSNNYIYLLWHGWLIKCFQEPCRWQKIKKTHTQAGKWNSIGGCGWMYPELLTSCVISFKKF